MFTLLVSWLLVACAPGLLMLAALGLGRLESELGHDTVTTTDVDDFLEHAEPVDVHTLAREGLPEALEYLHRRQAEGLSDPPSTGRHAGPRHAAPPFGTGFSDRGELALPPRGHRHSGANPQFSAPKHVNHV